MQSQSATLRSYAHLLELLNVNVQDMNVSIEVNPERNDMMSQASALIASLFLKTQINLARHCSQ